MKKPVKKAQEGTKVPKRNVGKDIKAERTATAQKNKRNVDSLKTESASNKVRAKNDYGAARSFLVDNNRDMYEFSKKQGEKQDSLSNVNAKKAKEAAKNPKYKSALKSGGKLKK
jgi:hypothetical protein